MSDEVLAGAIVPPFSSRDMQRNMERLYLAMFSDDPVYDVNRKQVIELWYNEVMFELVSTNGPEHQRALALVKAWVKEHRERSLNG